MGQKNMLNEYEQARIKRIEENKRKLQELGLENAAEDGVKAKKPKPARPQVLKARVPSGERRRSSRVALMPACNYEDKESLDLRGSRRSAPSNARRLVRRDVSDAVRVAALKAARGVEASLDPAHPSMSREMMPSHVSGCFWMGLPKGWCLEHLPAETTDLTLQDEDGRTWEARYLLHKNGLSGGWGGYAKDHDLAVGDVVTFELVAPTTFLMHIVRAADHEAVQDSKTVDKRGKRNENSRLKPPVKKQAKAREDSDEEEDWEDEDEEDDEVEEEEEEAEEEVEEEARDESEDGRPDQREERTVKSTAKESKNEKQKQQPRQEKRPKAAAKVSKPKVAAKVSKPVKQKQPWATNKGKMLVKVPVQESTNKKRAASSRLQQPAGAAGDQPRVSEANPARKKPKPVATRNLSNFLKSRKQIATTKKGSKVGGNRR